MNDATITALIEATIGHLYLPELDDKTRALGISETAVMAVTSVLHDSTGCTEPDPAYDDLDQMMTTCKRCEDIAVVVLKLGAMLSRPITINETGTKERVMDFGQALAALKAGERVQRAGWNGKGMWVALMPGYPDGVPANEATAAAHRVEAGSLVVVRPYLVMRAADGALVNWTVSQSDALAEDWSIVTQAG